MKHKNRKSYSKSYSRSRSRSTRSRSRSRTRSRSRDRYKSSRRGERRSSRAREVTVSSSKIDPTRINPTPSKCLGVFGLNPYITEKHLRETFSKYGRLDDCKLILDGKSGRSRGFGFVYYESEENAVQAKEALHGTDMEGQKIRVDFSITKCPHSPTPGIYMGFAQHRSGYRRSPPRLFHSRRSPKYSRYNISRSRSYESKHRRSHSPYHR